MPGISVKPELMVTKWSPLSKSEKSKEICH